MRLHFHQYSNGFLRFIMIINYSLVVGVMAGEDVREGEEAIEGDGSVEGEEMYLLTLVTAKGGNPNVTGVDGWC